MLDFLSLKELQNSVYIYLPEQKRLGTFSVSLEEKRLRVWIAQEFTGLDHNIEGIGPIIGYLKPPGRWHHLTFIHDGEEASMYRAYERLLESELIPVVKLEELAGATREDPAIAVRALRLRPDTPEYDAYRIKETIARRVPIDFTLRHDIEGLRIEPVE
ncbi:MAG: hypothetical protein PHF72_02790 [Gammaproteobacteria bacterium]|nr:hypothetical protein [Gammaproteobacteria bacterium]